MCWNGTRWEPYPYHWGGELEPYVKNTKVFLCPSKNDTVYSCIYNIYLNQRPDSTIDKPAETAVIADSTGNGFWGIDGITLVQYGNPNCRIRASHMDGANFAFADGHAKWQAGPSWLPSQWYPTWTP